MLFSCPVLLLLLLLLLPLLLLNVCRRCLPLWDSSTGVVQKAKSDPNEWAVLVGRCGGETPAVGTKMTYKSPLAYLE
jgi:hypothetical protein